MGKKFHQECGDWKQYRLRFSLCGLDEVDFHFGKRLPGTSFEANMAEVSDMVEDSLKRAQETGRQYLMFIHGSSTSRRGKTTARSQVRNFMRSPAATPLIERSHCIEHPTVFVAKVRPVSGTR
jgi:hypothetical protein